MFSEVSVSHSVHRGVGYPLSPVGRLPLEADPLYMHTPQVAEPLEADPPPPEAEPHRGRRPGTNI